MHRRSPALSLARDLIYICLVAPSMTFSHAQQRTAQEVVVSAEEEGEHDQFTEMGEYTQPSWAERSRFSSTTSVYVLSPYEVFAGNLWETDFPRHGKTLHNLTQEIDFGLPGRFEFGIENQLGLAGSDTHETSVTLEARYAFANWNVIPLNPSISAEYISGIGKSVKDAVNESNLQRQPNAVAVRLLLGQNFGDHFGYGVNIGVQQDVSHESGREWEISQSIVYGAMKGDFEVGAEMRYIHNTLAGNFIARDELNIGPTLGWKPTRQMRISLAPLFGCTRDSSRVANLLLVSYEFGGAESRVAPVSGNH